jgi:excinuclease ABC subunit C
VIYADRRNIDIIGFYQEDNEAICLVLRMQEGAIINQENYPLKNLVHESRESILASFLKLYYASREELPQEILLPHAPEDHEALSTWLKGRLVLPQRGEKTKLLAMAKRNAFHLIEEKKLAHLRKANRTIFPIQELKECLNLPSLPRKIVCMDISTIQGTDTVSSAVFFANGKPKKKYYRHFIIRSIDTQNDFAALQETLTRFLNEIDKEPDMRPDLFIIDGGKGQLSSTNEILKASIYHDISIISLAKRAEEIFLPGSTESIILPRSSSALRLITNIRDEAHRFAINFHRSRRSKRTLISELEDISGVGEQSKFLLLKTLGSVESIRKASIEDLMNIKGIGAKIAQTIYDYFKEYQ